MGRLFVGFWWKTNNFTSSNLCKLRPPEMKMSIYCFSKIVWDQFSLFWSEILFSSPHSRPSCQVWEWLSWPPTKNHSPFIQWSFLATFGIFICMTDIWSRFWSCMFPERIEAKRLVGSFVSLMQFECTLDPDTLGTSEEECGSTEK